MRFAPHTARSVAAAALLLIAGTVGLSLSGCTKKAEEPPATPPALPPVPPRPANQGGNADRYNQMMNQRGAATSAPAGNTSGR